MALKTWDRSPITVCNGNRNPLSVRLFISTMRNLFKRLPFSLLIVLCLTLGLAPFTPEPHIWEKLGMLASGDLDKPIGIFDLLLHGYC
jgi:hypothetical protein